MDETKHETHNQNTVSGQVVTNYGTVIQNFPNSTNSTKPSPPLEQLWHVPYRRNPFFTGREQLLDQLHNNLTASKAMALTQAQAINGLGGIGKTQVAIEYAYRFKNEYHSVFWLNADSHETLFSDFTTIANLLHLSITDERDQKGIVKTVNNWFIQHQDYLLIFDNADIVEIIDDFLPFVNKGHILLTTRAQATGSFAEPLQVEKMNLQEGILLLLRRAKRLAPNASLAQATTKDQSEAEAIVATLDGLPLAIDQAGAYIEEIGCQLSSYLTLYKHRQIELLKRRGMNTDHPKPVVTTWTLLFEHIERINPLAADLMRVFAFLHPENIPEEMIMAGASQLGSPLQSIENDKSLLDEAIGLLRRYSLIHRNIDDNSFTIHRLVQIVLKEAMGKAKQRQWAKRTVQAICQAFPDIAMETRLECTRYLPQALACANFIEQYQLIFPNAASLLHNAACFLMGNASYVEAEPLFQQALTIYEHTLGFEDSHTATCLDNLAQLYTYQSKFNQAEPLYQRSLAISERILGPSCLDMAFSLNNLGLNYSDQGEFEQAEPLFQRALTIFEQTLGTTHTNVAITLDNLASLYIQQDKLGRAEQLLQRAQAIFEQNLGPKHLTTIINFHNQAKLYELQGKFEQAEKLYLHVITLREQILGTDHLDTAGSVNNLAALYESQGKTEQAELFYFKSLAIREKILGTNQPEIAQSLNNLAMHFHHQGKLEQAESLYLRALTINEQALGPNHLETAHNYNNLAGVYVDQTKFEQAESLYLRALTIKEQILGPDHSEIAHIYNNLAGLYANQSKFEQAELYIQYALAIFERTLPPNHPDTATSLNNLAAIYQSQGKYEQAESLNQRALHIREQVLGPEHPDTASSLNNLAVLYESQGKYKQAEPLYQRALEIMEKSLGLEHSNTKIVRENYTRLRESMKRKQVSS